MQGAPWQRVKEVFEAALDVDAEARSRFLLEKCDADADLLRRVEQMLEADRAATSFLEQPWHSALGVAVPPEREEITLASGEVLHGRYRIVRELGAGGMGRVYEAHDLELNSRIALKVLRPELSDQPEMMRRFRQEVNAAHRVTHPNVCRTYHLERTSAPGANGPMQITFLTMEFLDGVTLSDHLKESGSLKCADGLRLARDIALALDAAHAAGIVHRDMKPGNVLLCGSKRDHTVVTDFGMARIDLPSVIHSTLTGRYLVGTLGYMAPEQMHGQPVTPAADIYAFGLILFEVFTGSRPGGVAVAGTQSPEPGELERRLAWLPWGWRAVLESCLHHDPAQRPASAMHVVRMLEGDILHSPWRWLRSGRPHWSILVTLFVLFLLPMSYFLLHLRLLQQRAGASLPPGALIYVAPIQDGVPQMTSNGITELLKASLSQSPRLTLLDEERAGDAMRGMGRTPEATITRTIGREIAMRTGAVRAVFPTLSRTGDRYSLELQVEQPSETPTRARQIWKKRWSWTSSDDSTVGAARVARDSSDWLRKMAGESADDIARLSVPPEDVTTVSWGALSDYALAERMYAQTRREDAVAALQNAVTKDPHFALAYALSGDILINIGQRRAGLKAYASALDDSEGERLSLRERARIKGLVAHDTGDFEAAEAAYREYTLYYPNDFIGWFRRGLPLYFMGRTGESVRVLENAHNLDPSRPTPLVQLVGDHLVLGNTARVDAVLDDLNRHYPRGFLLYASMAVLVTRGHYDQAGADATELRRSATPAMRFAGVYMGANLQAERGLYAGADDIFTDGLASVPGDATLLIRRAFIRCQMEHFRECGEDVAAALRSDPSATTAIEASQVLGRGATAAKGADRTAMLAALDALGRRHADRTDGLSGEIAGREVRGEELLAHGDVRAAVAELRAASALDPTVNLREPLARALEAYADRQTDKAAATRLRDEALDLRLPFTTNAARIWAHSQLYMPGAFADNLEATLRLYEKLGLPPPAEAKHQLTVLRIPEGRKL